MNQSNNPKISVITVCFNSERTIRRTIESVICQSYPNIEYIIVDGGSSDLTMSIIKEYEQAITTIVSEPDNGIYDAMNKGLVLASGDWLHIINSDDAYVGPEALARAIACLNPQCVNYFQMWRQHADGCCDLQDWPYSRWRLFVSAFLPHPSLIVSRAQYNCVGLYDTAYQIAADHDMILRLTARWPGLKHGFPLVVMDQGGVSATRLDVSIQEFRVVTQNHGLSGFIACLIARFKKIWWRI